MADSTKPVKVGKKKATKTSPGRAYGGFAGRTKVGGMGRAAMAIPGMAEAAKSFGRGGASAMAQFGEGGRGGRGAPPTPGGGTVNNPNAGKGTGIGGANYDVGEGGPTNAPGQVKERTNLPGQQGVAGGRPAMAMPQMAAPVTAAAPAAVSKQVAAPRERDMYTPTASTAGSTGSIAKASSATKAPTYTAPQTAKAGQTPVVNKATGFVTGTKQVATTRTSTAPTGTRTPTARVRKAF